MIIKYYLQKFFGLLLDRPIIKNRKSVGYSLVRSERVNCQMGDHTRVYPPFVLRNVTLGDYSYISYNSNINNCNIGRFCSIGPNFCCGLGTHPTNGISTSPMFYSAAKQNGVSLCKENKVLEFEYSTIGNDVFIGANVTVLDGVHISDGAVIGAGAVVKDDIPPYAIAVGVPAKIVKYRFDDDIIKGLLERRWWDDPEEKLKTIEESFWDIRRFLRSSDEKETHR